LFGTKKEISLNVEKYCRECREKMGLHFPSHVIECSNCKGKGVIKTQSFFGILSSTCPQCQGQGGRFRTEKKVIKFSIPKGIQNNTKLRYRGVGNDS
jgi:molecular chaperone DnaJ